MSKLLEFILKKMGTAWLLKKAYSAVQPKLREWAEADGEDDWDDALVDILDSLVEAIAGKLEEEKK